MRDGGLNYHRSIIFKKGVLTSPLSPFYWFIIMVKLTGDRSRVVSLTKPVQTNPIRCSGLEILCLNTGSSLQGSPGYYNLITVLIFSSTDLYLLLSISFAFVRCYEYSENWPSFCQHLQTRLWIWSGTQPPAWSIDWTKLRNQRIDMCFIWNWPVNCWC